jgi:hypothetical protein
MEYTTQVAITTEAVPNTTQYHIRGTLGCSYAPV